MSTPANPRRRFIRLAVVGASAPWIAGPAFAADLPHLEETDPTAAALGYKHDTGKADSAKYPNHTAEQLCLNCNLAQAAQGDGWVPCSIFPGKAVNSKGWCAAWAKKA